MGGGLRKGGVEGVSWAEVGYVGVGKASHCLGARYVSKNPPLVVFFFGLKQTLMI